MRAGERQTDRQTGRERGRDRGRDRQRQRDRDKTETDRQTETEAERERMPSNEREREREIREEKRREDNTLLHRDKDLSTCRLFCKSVPDDKHSNTQYIKQEFNLNTLEKKRLKNKTKLISV